MKNIVKMSYQLITCEKPMASLKIATALSETKPVKKSISGVAYYEIVHNNRKIIIASAAGHLFTLAEKNKSNQYPVFDIEWVPAYKSSKKAKFTKKFYDVLKMLSKNSESHVNACDVDIEGELIFKNILELIYSSKKASRMYFSTLTKEDLINSYKNMKSDINYSLAEAGETRHILDYYWGISTSRALTLAIKNATKYHKIMSTGRVQGPALKLIVDKEREIKAFKSTPYWEIELIVKYANKNVIAFHKEGKFWDKGKALLVIERTKDKKAKVSKLYKKQYAQSPPHPFDLTSLQIEAYRVFKISPKETLEIAQNLYLLGIISYPRTSSNQLPPSINYKKILSLLGQQSIYKKLVDDLLNKEKLTPNNGKKTDPAHPAIYPTGESPKKNSEKELKIYDLIVKRTLASFAESAIRETVNVEIDINSEIFIASGVTTLKKGWHQFYNPYIPFKEEELPNLAENQELNIQEIKLLDKETQPPKRYTPASIIKDLEKRGLGTKATRSVIIDTLYQRHYVQNESIEATNLGIKTIETLEKFCSEIVDGNLTRHFEKEMDQIQELKKNEQEVLEEAKKILIKTFKRFKENEIKIGKSLSEANIQTQNEQSIVGKCNLCAGNLKITYSKKNSQYFVACSKYPECKNTFSVPKKALIKPTNKVCNECGFPLVAVIRKGKRPFEYCINMGCNLKEEWRKNNIILKS
ncbi:DNA topoisomerase I [Candidatus Woesearchaeota archaeon]|nr:DNA topoisomerase I [Candidatus Woesearchaeota archaeon]